MIGETPTTGAGVVGDRLADARHREDRADRDHRVRGGEQHEVGAGDRLDDAGRRARRIEVALPELDRGQRGAVAGPPLLEVQLALAARRIGVGDEHVRVDLGVGRGDQPNPERPATLQPLGDLRWRRALAQPGGAGEVRAEIEVAEGEPGPSDAPLAQLGGDALGLARSAPAPLGVVHARERVEQRVEVGHQAHAREPEVVAGVHDDGDGCLAAVALGHRRRATSPSCPPSPSRAPPTRIGHRRRTSSRTPRTKRAPPTPPASTVIFTLPTLSARAPIRPFGRVGVRTVRARRVEAPDAGRCGEAG